MWYGEEPDVNYASSFFLSHLIAYANWLVLQKKSLLSLYDTKVKALVKKLLTLSGYSETYVLGDLIQSVIFNKLFIFDTIIYLLKSIFTISEE